MARLKKVKPLSERAMAYWLGLLSTQGIIYVFKVGNTYINIELLVGLMAFVLLTLKHSGEMIGQIKKTDTTIKVYLLSILISFFAVLIYFLQDRSIKVQSYFNAIVESSVVGIRKPDPAIFALGVRKLGWQPAQIAVIGDSFSKDIYPASLIGCKTIWLKGEGWDENVDTTLPTVIIDDFGKLREVFNI